MAGIADMVPKCRKCGGAGDRQGLPGTQKIPCRTCGGTGLNEEGIKAKLLERKAIEDTLAVKTAELAVSLTSEVSRARRLDNALTAFEAAQVEMAGIRVVLDNLRGAAEEYMVDVDKYAPETTKQMASAHRAALEECVKASPTGAWAEALAAGRLQGIRETLDARGEMNDEAFMVWTADVLGLSKETAPAAEPAAEAAEPLAATEPAPAPTA